MTDQEKAVVLGVAGVYAIMSMLLSSDGSAFYILAAAFIVGAVTWVGNEHTASSNWRVS